MESKASNPPVRGRPKRTDQPDPKQNQDNAPREMTDYIPQLHRIKPNITFDCSPEKQNHIEQTHPADHRQVFNPKRPSMFVWLSEGSENTGLPSGGRFLFVPNSENHSQESQGKTPPSDLSPNLADPLQKPFHNVTNYLIKIFSNEPMRENDVLLSQHELLLLKAILIRKFPNSQKKL